MIEWLIQLFCKHDYEIEFTGFHEHYLYCKKCNKVKYK
jgi:hypothetical protein